MKVVGFEKEGVRPVPVVFLYSWRTVRRQELFQRFDKIQNRYYGGWEYINNINPTFFELHNPFRSPSAIAFLEYEY